MPMLILMPLTFSSLLQCITDFPGSSADKKSACNAGDHSSIPRLGRSPGEWIGCPLQYSWISLVAQTVENPLAMRETWVQSLGWEDSPEDSSILALTILMDRGAPQSMGLHRVRHDWATKHARTMHSTAVYKRYALGSKTKIDQNEWMEKRCPRWTASKRKSE